MKYILTLLTLMLFLGCGDATDETTPAPAAIIIEMEPNRSYIVYSGDLLEKTSDNAEVSITKTAQDDTTTVVLLVGTAQITRAN